MRRTHKIIFSLLALSAATLGSAQVISSKKWQDLFSYNNVLQIRSSEGKVLAATENGLFYYNPADGSTQKLSKANGLHDVNITAFDYNPETKTGLVGYQNGSLDLISPSGVLYIVDIPIAPGFNGNKRINHISITGSQAVISAEYGVSIFNLTKKEFGETAFFSTGGKYEAAREAVIRDNVVYAATATGIKTHQLNIGFPIYSSWQTAIQGDFYHLSNGSTIAASTKTTVYTGAGFSPSPEGFTAIDDVVVTGNNVVVTDGTRIKVLTLSGAMVNSLTVDDRCNTATLLDGVLYGGTKTAGLKTADKKSYKPDGPYSNRSFKISLLENQIWVSSAVRDDYNQPISSGLGYYHYDGSKWNYPTYFLQTARDWNVFDVKPDPSNPSQVYFTNYTFEPGSKGIYKMENNTFVKQYQASDSSPYNNRAEAISFDENNNLFVFCGFFDNPTTSSAYYFYNRAADSFSTVPLPNAGNSQNMVAKDGLLYAACPFFTNGGLIIKNYGTAPNAVSNAQDVVRKADGLPIDGVVSVAVDRDDDVWIGTHVGLRILSNAKEAASGAGPDLKPVVITQGGIPEEIFRDNTILQIAVDGGNNKWVSVDGGGVYYLSPDGTRTLLHFTKENSPLPTNTVTDIGVDTKTGKVYFVTHDGVVSYQSDVADVTDNFGNVVVYPNPVVTSQFGGKVTIKGLAMKTNIRITDAAGNLVHSAVARGGVYEWDLTRAGGQRVASGIYFVLLTNADGTDKTTAKIAVVN